MDLWVSIQGVAILIEDLVMGRMERAKRGAPMSLRGDCLGSCRVGREVLSNPRGDGLSWLTLHAMECRATRGTN